MGVDRLEGGEQPDAAFAIEIADRPAQPVYRLLQFVDLGRVPFALAVEFGEFIGGDQIDRAEPLTRGEQSVVRSRFGSGVADAVTLEARLLRQQIGRASCRGRVSQYV